MMVLLVVASIAAAMQLILHDWGEGRNHGVVYWWAGLELVCCFDPLIGRIKFLRQSLAKDNHFPG